MIISATDLKKMVNCDNVTDEQIATHLVAIETIIRKYTNNNFQLREIRFSGASSGMNVYGDPTYFTVGDTVQISDSKVNDGLYQITEIGVDYVQLDKDLMTIDHNLVTKIKYPADVIQCAIDLFKWKQNMGEKVGIKSETISRHSVTYEDSGTLFMGYPTGILNGLSLYKKARC